VASRFLDILNQLHDHRVDFVIVGGVAGESDRFDELKSRAVPVTLDNRTFFVASIDDLIAMKRSAGRPQDVLDIAQLQDIQRRTP
jgi:predicted nucleotidyltransferase